MTEPTSIDPTVEFQLPFRTVRRRQRTLRRLLSDPQRNRLEEELAAAEFRLATRIAGLPGPAKVAAAQVARAHAEARASLVDKRVDEGFTYLHLADEAELALLSDAELAARMDRMRREAESSKLVGWRAAHVLEMLKRAEALPPGTARLPFVSEATTSLNIGAQNEYRKITLLRRTQTILLMTGLPLLVAVVWLIAVNADHFGIVDGAWVMLASACLGALGGVASSLQRLTRNRVDRIPLVIGNYVVSFSRAMIGAAAGLLAYLAQRVIIETDGSAKVGGILAAAFAAGFAERLLPANPAAEDQATPPSA